MPQEPRDVPGPSATLSVGVLADDLTGAHSSAARLRQAGLATVVTWHRRPPPAGTTAMAVDMRTRDYGTDPASRARRWARYLGALDVRQVELRTDSTLRGDPAAELAGTLHGLAEPDVTVLAVPAFPSAGRVVRNGQLDAKNVVLPHRQRDAAARIFGPRRGEAVPLSEPTVRDGAGAVVDAVAAAVRGGRHLFLADSVDEDDLRTLAVAAETLQTRHLLPGRLLTISPGAWLAYRPVPAQGTFVLVVLSSQTDVNRAQLDVLRERRTCLVLSAHDVVAGRVPGPLVAAGSTTVVETLSVRAHDDAEAWAQSTVAAHAAGQVLECSADASGPPCAGVVCGGGQTASALMDCLDAGWLETGGELAPLCPVSRLRGGPYAGLRLVTKGGLVGDANTLTDLVAALADQHAPTRTRPEGDTSP